MRLCCLAVIAKGSVWRIERKYEQVLSSYVSVHDAKFMERLEAFQGPPEKTDLNIIVNLIPRLHSEIVSSQR